MNNTVIDIQIFKGPYKGYTGEYLGFVKQNIYQNSRTGSFKIGKIRPDNRYTHVKTEKWYKLRVHPANYNQEIIINPIDTSRPDTNTIRNVVIEQTRSPTNSTSSKRSRSSMNSITSSRSSKSSRGDFEDDYLVVVDDDFVPLNPKRKRSSPQENPRKRLVVHESFTHDNYVKPANKQLFKIMEDLFRICNLTTESESVSIHTQALDTLLNHSSLTVKKEEYPIYAAAYIFIYLNELGKQIDHPVYQRFLTPNWDPDYIYNICVETNVLPRHSKNSLINAIDSLLRIKGTEIIRTETVKVYQQKTMLKIKQEPKLKIKYREFDNIIVKPFITTAIKNNIISEINKKSTSKTTKNFEGIIKGTILRKNISKEELKEVQPYLEQYYKMVKFESKEERQKDIKNKIIEKRNKEQQLKDEVSAILSVKKNIINTYLQNDKLIGKILKQMVVDYKNDPRLAEIVELFEKIVKSNVKITDVKENYIQLLSPYLKYYKEQLNINKESFYEEQYDKKVLIDFITLIDSPEDREKFLKEHKQEEKSLIDFYENTYKPSVVNELNSYRKQSITKNKQILILDTDIKTNLINERLEYLRQVYKRLEKEDDKNNLKYILDNYYTIINLSNKEVEKSKIIDITQPDSKKLRNVYAYKEYSIFHEMLHERTLEIKKLNQFVDIGNKVPLFMTKYGYNKNVPISNIQREEASKKLEILRKINENKRKK